MNPPASPATLADQLQQSQTRGTTVRCETTGSNGEARFFVKVVSTVSAALVQMTAPQVATPVRFLLNVTRITVGRAPAAVAVVDLNHDGRPDLVTANPGSNDISVRLGHGDGTFATRQRFAVGTQPQAVAVADFNGDIAPDLVTADAGFSAATVLLGRGDGTLGKLQLSPKGDSERQSHMDCYAVGGAYSRPEGSCTGGMDTRRMHGPSPCAPPSHPSPETVSGRPTGPLSTAQALPRGRRPAAIRHALLPISLQARSLLAESV